MEEHVKELVPPTSFEKALEAMNLHPGQLPLDPLALLSNQFRLRPSEEAAILVQRYLNPPPPWGIKINLSRSFLGPEKCLELGRRMILSKSVTFLDLSFCDLEEKAAQEFFFCIERNTTLLHLNVNGNTIKDTGACAAAKCIRNLETLHISSNEITDVGAIAIADNLRMSNKIKTLNIRNNKISIYGLYKIMDAMEPALDLMPNDVKSLIAQKEGPPVLAVDGTAETANSKNGSTSDRAPPAVDDEETKEGAENVIEKGAEKAPEIVEIERTATTAVEPVAADVQEITDALEEEEEIPYNETLHTLWVDYNDPFDESILRNLNTVLAKRVPQPPPGAKPKKKGKGKDMK